jgi:hypothetical protein
MEHDPTPKAPPGHRSLTNLPQLPNRGIRPSPFGQGAPKWQPFNAIAVAQGVEGTFHADFIVEAWLVAVVAAAGVSVIMSPGPSAAGATLFFGGGGNAMIPGDGGGDLAYRVLSTNPATIIAIATDGYKWELTYDPGDLA